MLEHVCKRAEICCTVQWAEPCASGYARFAATCAVEPAADPSADGAAPKLEVANVRKAGHESSAFLVGIDRWALDQGDLGLKSRVTPDDTPAHIIALPLSKPGVLPIE